VLGLTSALAEEYMKKRTSTGEIEGVLSRTVTLNDVNRCSHE